MVYVTCGECESSIIAIVAMSGLGIVSLGLVTDMTEEDTKKMMEEQEISGNDMLNLYELFKTKSDSALKKLTDTK